MAFAAGVAVSVTCVPDLKAALQTVGQLIPVGVLVTVPVPVPLIVTLSTGDVLTLNVAVTEVLLSKVTLQVPVPLQAPPHPPKMALAAGVAVSVTFVPNLKAASQVEGQLIPAGALVTVPVPVPLNFTLSIGDEPTLKVAVTELSPFKVTVQVLAPPQAPSHPANVAPAAGSAVRVTWVPALKVPTQTWPQFMPAGLLVIVPTPLPPILTLN